MGEHLIDGEFKSDKYKTVPVGKVPISTKDPLAQDLLWILAERYRDKDAEFSNDLQQALRNDGYTPPASPKSGGAEQCPNRSCGWCGARSDKHHFSTMHVRHAAAAPEHPAAVAGCSMWWECHHCDRWVECSPLDPEGGPLDPETRVLRRTHLKGFRNRD